MNRTIVAALIVFVVVMNLMSRCEGYAFGYGYLNWYGLPYSYGVAQIRGQCRDNCLTTYSSGCLQNPTVACSDRYAACVAKCSLK